MRDEDKLQYAQNFISNNGYKELTYKGSSVTIQSNASTEETEIIYRKPIEVFRDNAIGANELISKLENVLVHLHGDANALQHMFNIGD